MDEVIDAMLPRKASKLQVIKNRTPKPQNPKNAVKILRENKTLGDGI